MKRFEIRTCRWAMFMVLCYLGAVLGHSVTDLTLQNRGGSLDSLVGKTNAKAMSLTHTSGFGPTSNKFSSFKQRIEKLETFNRPGDSESVAAITGGPNANFETSYGRTFGQYGSYKDHTSWQNAVASDRLRNQMLNTDIKMQFPWLKDHLQKPRLHGFGLDTFWNSYAVPEGTPTVKGLGPQKPLQEPTDKVVSRFHSWQ